MYKSGDDPLDPFNEDERFEYGVLLNGIQALCSCLAASLYLLYRRRGIPSQGRGLLGHLGLDVLTPTGCQQALVARGKRKANEPLRGLRKYVSPLWQQYLLVSALQSTASWLSIVALRHLSFPAITLAKSSKLVPVLLMNVLLYRRHFAAYKYVVVFLVTLGVWMFMALGKKKAVKGPKGNSVLGMTLLGIHLLLDGATNSTQDEVFETYGPLVSGTQMMLVMNAMSASYMVTALLLPEGIVTYAMTHMRMHLASWLHPHWVAQVITAGLSHPTMTWTPQVVSGVQFLLRHPDAARDVLLYALAGAAGQIAIFETLERFGSLTLVSITVCMPRVLTARLHANCLRCCYPFSYTSTTFARCNGSVWQLSSLACLLRCDKSSANQPRLLEPRRSESISVLCSGMDRHAIVATTCTDAVL